MTSGTAFDDHALAALRAHPGGWYCMPCWARAADLSAPEEGHVITEAEIAEMEYQEARVLRAAGFDVPRAPGAAPGTSWWTTKRNAGRPTSTRAGPIRWRISAASIRVRP